jgi:hypothetical protein
MQSTLYLKVIAFVKIIFNLGWVWAQSWPLARPTGVPTQATRVGWSIGRGSEVSAKRTTRALPYGRAKGPIVATRNNPLLKPAIALSKSNFLKSHSRTRI